MSDELAPAGGEPIAVITPAEDTGTNLSLSEAARALNAARFKPKEDKPAAPVEAAAEPELAETPTDDQPEADPVETDPQPEPAEPPIEPPRSWTKDEKDEFATYPREAQEKIARREQERETALRRSQNEAADARKATEADRAKTEQARLEYEAALPRVLGVLKDSQAAQFAEIKTPADAMALAQNDPARYVQYRAQQDIIAQAEAESRAAQDRQLKDYQSKWESYAVEQDKKLIDALPEFADTTKQKQIADAVVRTLENVGVTKEDLGKAWTGEASFSPRDHRFQQIFIKAALYDQAKAAPKPAPKPVPPVQRPGVAKPAGAANSEIIQTLATKLERSGSLKDAVALREAQIARAQRRA